MKQSEPRRRSSQHVLVIFLKYPEAGRVKTRLAEAIGKNQAAKLYRLFCERICNNFRSDSWNILVCYTPYRKRGALEEWLGSENDFLFQKGKNLGERLNVAVQCAFKRGAKRVVVIGTDMPQLGQSEVKEAFRKLQKYDAVIGPATDGGYYLLGLCRYDKRIFERIQWSTNAVYGETCSRLRDCRFSTAILKKKMDIDTISDLKLLKQKLSNDRNLRQRLGFNLCRFLQRLAI